MKTLALFLVAINFFTQAWGAKYNVDPGHTYLTFFVTHMGVAKNHGRFNDISGELTWDEAKKTYGPVNISVKTASVDTVIKKKETST